MTAEKWTKEQLDAELDEYLAGRTPEETKQIYIKKASNYDEDVSGYNFTTPEKAAEAFNTLGVPKDAKILDTCVGTGNGGVALQKLGYTNLDGLDMTEAMLEVAKKKNVYKNFHVGILEIGHKLPIPDNTYDAVILVGAFCPGHVYVDSFAELIRIVKKGGYVCWSHFDLSTLTAKYGEKWSLEKMNEHIDNFAKQGLWKRAKDPISLGKSGGDIVGEEWLEVMQVL